MTAIKLLLLAGVALFGILAYRGSQSAGRRALWRLGGVVVLVGAALSVLFPDSLTRVARTVGVGRGADLVLYVLVVAFMLVTVGLFRRLADLENRYVLLARRIALAEAASKGVLGPQGGPDGRTDVRTGDGAGEPGRPDGPTAPRS